MNYDQASQKCRVYIKKVKVGLCNEQFYNKEILQQNLWKLKNK